jgi:serine/threonine protein kinase
MSLPSLPPGTRLGPHYEVQESIGSGTYGDVYRVIHIPTGKQRAAKIFDTTLLDKDGKPLPRAVDVPDDYEGQTVSVEYTTEYTMLKRLNELCQTAYPICPRFYGTEAYMGRPVIIMELFESTLRGQALFRDDSMALKIFTARTLFRALRSVHMLGMSHGDIKPDNVLVRRTKSNSVRVVLADWGSARSIAVHEKTEQYLDATFEPRQTVSAAAPETMIAVGRDQRRHSDREDVFAMGYMLASMLHPTRVSPFAWTAYEIATPRQHTQLCRESGVICMEGGKTFPCQYADVQLRRLRDFRQDEPEGIFGAYNLTPAPAPYTLLNIVEPLRGIIECMTRWDPATRVTMVEASRMFERQMVQQQEGRGAWPMLGAR